MTLGYRPSRIFPSKSSHERRDWPAEVGFSPAHEPWFARGKELYGDRPDKSWSLTDCISFVVMTERGISDALTGDHHFVQARFRALHLPSPG